MVTHGTICHGCFLEGSELPTIRHGLMGWVPRKGKRHRGQALKTLKTKPGVIGVFRIEGIVDQIAFLRPQSMVLQRPLGRD